MTARAHAKNERRLAVGLLLLNTAIWGAALVIVKPSFAHISPFFFLFLRFFLAGSIMLPWLLWTLVRKHTLVQHLPKIFVLELIGTTLSLGLLYEGLARTTALEASFITITSPVFITLGGIIFLHEREERREWLGLLLAVTGSLLLVLDPVLSRHQAVAIQGSLVGNGLVLLQNFALATYYLLAKKWYRGVPKLFVTSVSFLVGAVSFGLLSLTQGAISFSAVSVPSVQLAVMYMAVLGSIVALTAYIAGQDRIEASEAALFTYLQPLVFVPLSIWWLHEKLTWPLILGITLVVSGVFWAQKRQKNHRH